MSETDEGKKGKERDGGKDQEGREVRSSGRDETC